MSTALQAAVLVVSDTAAKDATTDKCEPVLRDVFAQAASEAISWQVKHVAIVSDDVAAIQRQMLQWTDSTDSVNLIVTSGGTGFATKDVTPEAVSPLLHKHAPGLIHAMLSTSLQVTPFAMMARPVAGVRNGTLILTLPGSPKGAKENLEAVVKLLAHACQQAQGANSRSLHAEGVKKLEEQAGVSATAGKGQQSSSHSHGHAHHHHHHHHHGHQAPKAHTDPNARPQANDPSAPPTLRQRASPYPMIPVAEALDLISKHVPEPTQNTVPLSTSVIGSILAAPVRAREAVPAFRASIVDGYAVSLPCPAGIYSVSQISHAQASSSSTSTLETNTVARITTGAPLPDGADAVIMVEDTRIASTTADGAEEATIEILTSALQPGDNVREIGSDVALDSVVLEAGDGISALGGEYALLASVGTRSVTTYRKPVIGVLSTGDELVPHEQQDVALRHGQVRDTNRPSLLAAARNAGFEAVDLGIAADKPGALEEKLREALSRVDVLVSSGGVSMGELDLLKPTVERKLGGTIHFGRVGMKPGLPTTFATVDVKDVRTTDTAAGNSTSTGAAEPGAGSGSVAGGGGRSKKVVFALPGNPASAIVTFQLFVLPALQKLSGVRPANGLPRVTVTLAERIRCNATRQEYVRAVVAANNNNNTTTTGNDVVKKAGARGGLVARSTGGQRSSRVGSFKAANALVIMPVREGWMEAGEEVEALLIGSIVSL